VLQSGSRCAPCSSAWLSGVLSTLNLLLQCSSHIWLAAAAVQRLASGLCVAASRVEAPAACDRGKANCKACLPHRTVHVCWRNAGELHVCCLMLQMPGHCATAQGAMYPYGAFLCSWTGRGSGTYGDLLMSTALRAYCFSACWCSWVASCD
jgi:hypothetical protein